MARTLILACGNPLRGDDGVAWQIAGALEESAFAAEFEIITAQQLTPDLAEPVSRAETLIFIDASATAPGGSVSLDPVSAANPAPGTLTHGLDPATLLATSQILYGRVPPHTWLLIVGGVSFALSEDLSEPARRAVPIAVKKIESLVAVAGALGATKKPRAFTRA